MSSINKYNYQLSELIPLVFSVDKNYDIIGLRYLFLNT